MNTFQDVIGKITTTTVKAASSRQVADAASKATEFGRRAAIGARGLMAFGAKFRTVTKCPACESLNIVKTDGGGTWEDGYKCSSCEHEFTAFGPAIRRGFVKGSVKVATLVVTGIGVVLENL